ncbi:hypothetical protein EDD85DRAFT_798646 [Armillaria nabsnona]|nr:hypothetical protein EDD85DRAFT_798646 [Armillaria nabsnona]
MPKMESATSNNEAQGRGLRGTKLRTRLRGANPTATARTKPTPKKKRRRIRRKLRRSSLGGRVFGTTVVTRRPQRISSWSKRKWKTGIDHQLRTSLDSPIDDAPGYHRHQSLYPSRFLRPNWNDTPPIETILTLVNHLEHFPIQDGFVLLDLQLHGAGHSHWTQALSYLTSSVADIGMWNVSTRELQRYPVVHGRAEHMDHLYRVRFPTLTINGRAYIG